MHLRWLALCSLILFLFAPIARANHRTDLPTSGGGVLNDCGSPHEQPLLFFSTSPVLSLTPMTIKDSFGNAYTAHVDFYDWGNLACLYPGYSSTDENEIRTSGTYSVVDVYVVGPDGSTLAQAALKSFEIAKTLANPVMNVCMGGWTYCNTAIDGIDQDQAALLQPAASPAADGSNTVWSFGVGYDLGQAAGGPTTAIPLNSNMDSSYGGVGLGAAVLVANGTVTCETGDGLCNGISASTPYSLTFLPPGDTTPLTVTTLPAKTFTSAAGHDSSTNPISISGTSFQGLYNASGNYPTLTNGLPVNSNGTSATGVTFSCSAVSSSPVQQFRSVYFKWVAPSTATFTLSTAGSHYDTILSVSGGAVQACNDDSDPNSIGVVTSSVTFQAVSGTTYQFLVTEYPQAQTPLGSIFYPNTQQDVYIGPLSGDSSLYLNLASAPVDVTTSGGTSGYVPFFNGSSTVANSLIQQFNGGIGIRGKPLANLDVTGYSIFRGSMILSRSNNASSSAGYPSYAQQFQSSAYNSSTKSNLQPYFEFQTEPVGNNTASTGATLNFLYYPGTGASPSESGLYVNPNGTIHFAAGQTFTAGVASPALVIAPRGEPGAAGPVGPAGPAGTVGPNIAIPGTITASRGFLSESSDASSAQFTASNSAAYATVVTLNSTGKGSYGLLARSAYIGLYAAGSRYAARFNGALATDSTLTGNRASFQIDDPLDSANKSLSHSTVSSPEMLDLYNGIVTSDATGTAVVNMPKYFEALDRDLQYQLTVIGQFSRAIVATRMANGTFTIRTERPNVKVSWQVTGVRQDAWANAHPVSVEAAKPSPDTGLSRITKPLPVPR